MIKTRLDTFRTTLDVVRNEVMEVLNTARNMNIRKDTPDRSYLPFFVQRHNRKQRLAEPHDNTQLSHNTDPTTRGWTDRPALIPLL